MVVTVAMTKPFLSVLTFFIAKGWRSDVVNILVVYTVLQNNVAFRVRTKVARRKLPTFPSSSHLFVTSSSHSQNYHRRSSSLKDGKEATFPLPRLFSLHLHGWSKRCSTGCVNQPLRQRQGHGFTQPRDHLLDHPCSSLCSTVSLRLRRCFSADFLCTDRLDTLGRKAGTLNDFPSASQFSPRCPSLNNRAVLRRDGVFDRTGVRRNLEALCSTLIG